jgi:glycosyltransferase involved in cell wall biosynthesis
MRLDLVHDPNGIAPFLGPAYGAKRVVTIHDAFAYVCPGLHNRLDNWRYWWMVPAAARRADAVLTVSRHARSDLQRFLGLDASRIAVVYGGVAPRFRPVPDGPARRATLERYGIRGRYVLYVGGINGRKNVAGLLEAFAQLTQAADGASPQLVICGKRQWATAEIEAALSRLRLGERVVFTGYVDEHDLPALYSAAELFVFPTLYEGFGLPPLEAMACGTPVVTSAVTSVPEVVGDAALLVEPTDTAAVASAMRSVLDDAALAAQLQSKGLVRARQFTWERVAQQVLAVYEGVLADHVTAPGAL